jgi:hypothetical protein
MANSAISGAMSGIDPQLGSSYKPASTGSYTVNANPFGASQTTFTGGSTATPQPSVAPATAQPQAAAARPSSVPVVHELGGEPFQLIDRRPYGCP